MIEQGEVSYAILVHEQSTPMLAMANNNVNFVTHSSM